MSSVLLAETAVLMHLQTIGIVLLILDGIVIALLAILAGQRNLNTLIRCHRRHLLYESMGPQTHPIIVAYVSRLVNRLEADLTTYIPDKGLETRDFQPPATGFGLISP